MSVWHWLIVVAVGVFWVTPVVLIVRKAGFSAWWGLLALLPGLNAVLLWVFALVAWPVHRVGRAPST